jgi:hypothetical protein
MQEADDRDTALSAALRGVAEEDARAGASTAVEMRLREAVRGIRRARRCRAYASALAVAAALMLAVAVAMWRAARPAPPPAQDAHREDVRREVATAFFPLPYSGVPFTDGRLVRLEVPGTALVSFGLASPEVADEFTSRRVLADVLVGEDGLARAVRFVRPIPRKEQKP